MKLKLNKEREKTVKIKRKIADLDKLIRQRLEESLPGYNLDAQNEENKSQNIQYQTNPVRMVTEHTPYSKMDSLNNEKKRPTTSHLNNKVTSSYNSDIHSSINYGEVNTTDDLRAHRQERLFIKKRNVMSAIPKGRPPPQFKRVSIKKTTEKGMRHGKFSKFLEFLLEIKNEAQNGTTDDAVSLHEISDNYYTTNASENRIGKRNMSAPGRPRNSIQRKQISDYYIFTIAKEAENYFKLDEVRKQRVRDKLVAQLAAERKKYEQAKVSIFSIIF